MMFAADLTQWTKLCDIPALKKIAQSIAEEESRSTSLLSSVGDEEQTFSSEMYKDDMPSVQQQPSINTTKEEEEEASVKEFINDAGIRHIWDREMNDWVVAEEGDDASEEGLKGTSSGSEEGKSKETSEFFKELDDGKAGGDTTEPAAKRKRNKKKKKTSDWNASSNLWVYVNHLPLDVTQDEIKAHFSKVKIASVFSICALNCTAVFF